MQNAIHATPKGAWPSIRGGRYYKHGAPNGAGNIFVAEDTYNVQAGADAFRNLAELRTRVMISIASLIGDPVLFFFPSSRLPVFAVHLLAWLGSV